MEQKTKNYLKLGILLFGVYLLSIKCQPDMTFDADKKINAKTVSFKQAKAFFKENKPKITYLKNGNNLTLTPDWNTLSQTELEYTDALLTKAETNVNRTGDFQSQLVFINIDNEIRSVIVTSWSSNFDTDNNLLDGLLFLNEYDGTFIDAYRIENGFLTKKIIPSEASINQASFLSILSLAIAFQSNQELQPDDCWNLDILAEFSDGDLNEVDLGTISSSGSGGFDGGLAQGPVGTGANYGSYLNGAIGTSGGNGIGSNTVRGISNSGLGQVAVASLLNPLTGNNMKDPDCESLKKLIDPDKPNFNVKSYIDDLKSKTSLDKEYYCNFKKQWDETEQQYNNTPQEGGIAEGITQTASKIFYSSTWFGVIHTHPIDTYSMFSWTDLRAIKLIYENVYEDYKNDVFNMIVNHNGSVYAIKVNNISVLIAKIQADLNGSTFEEKREELEDKLAEKYEKSTNLELTFLKEFKTYGVDLYKATDSNVTNWEKVTLNPDEDNTINIPCN